LCCFVVVESASCRIFSIIATFEYDEQ